MEELRRAAVAALCELQRMAAVSREVDNQVILELGKALNINLGLTDEDETLPCKHHPDKHPQPSTRIRSMGDGYGRVVLHCPRCKATAVTHVTPGASLEDAIAACIHLWNGEHGLFYGPTQE